VRRKLGHRVKYPEPSRRVRQRRRCVPRMHMMELRDKLVSGNTIFCPTVLTRPPACHR
jgi:hypothetical protein